MAGLQPTTGTYHFTLLLPGVERFTRESVDRLFEAGCDDATLFMRLDTCHISFSRTSTSFREAVRTALENVRLVYPFCDIAILTEFRQCNVDLLTLFPPGEIE